ncbi:MAG: DUF3592 domain-containing protein [Bdellovibrionales bacterium]|jgi:hypothetical protein|nr:DUF3592 domain-containing protein [Bdellovibrionales bacterium]MBT3526598.1 DUF3592 domain-containing protein [Bdellovibrionales bacterium]MBT7668035.1 DUF3592 domain-containing protein [Bdellovibrionales bacterium]MBT7767778.1 DUF3592 domain-containing protein [Bdellovibrionales bacterium]
MVGEIRAIYLRRIADLIFYMLFLFLALSALIFYQTITTINRYRAVDSWPYTQGWVTTSKVISTKASKIIYRYQVGNNLYQGNRFKFVVVESLPWKKTEAIRERFTVGQEVIVYYSPVQESLSTLSTNLIPLYGRLLFMPLVIALTTLLWRARRKRH